MTDDLRCCCSTWKVCSVHSPVPDNDLRSRIAAILQLHGDHCTRANADRLADVLVTELGVDLVRGALKRLGRDR